MKKTYDRYGNKPENSDIHDYYDMCQKHPIAGDCHICRHFACGNTLTLLERQCGYFCHNHTGQRIENQTLVTYFAGLFSGKL